MESRDETMILSPSSRRKRIITQRQSSSKSSEDLGHTIPDLQGPSKPVRNRPVKYNKNSRDRKVVLIGCYNDGKTVKESAEIAGININTAKSIIKAYNENGADLVECRRGGSKKKITTDVLNEIENIFEENPLITLKMIQEKIVERKNLRLGLSSINNALKQLRMTLKCASTQVECRNSLGTMYQASITEEQREKQTECRPKYRVSPTEEQREQIQQYNHNYTASLSEEQREKQRHRKLKRQSKRNYLLSLTREQCERKQAELAEKRRTKSIEPQSTEELENSDVTDRSSSTSPLIVSSSVLTRIKIKEPQEEINVGKRKNKITLTPEQIRMRERRHIYYEEHNEKYRYRYMERKLKDQNIFMEEEKKETESTSSYRKTNMTEEQCEEKPLNRLKREASMREKWRERLIANHRECSDSSNEVRQENTKVCESDDSSKELSDSKMNDYSTSMAVKDEIEIHEIKIEYDVSND